MNERAIRERELLSHLGWVKGLALNLVGDIHRAEDVTQEVCRTALERRPEQKGPVLRAWLKTATRFLARNELRGGKRREAREARASRQEATLSTFDVVARNALVQRVSKEVMALPEPYRSTVLYRYLDGLTPLEIAVKMNVPAATLRKRLSRGLEMLRSRLGRSGIDRAYLSALFALPIKEGVAAAKVSTATGVGIMLSKAQALTGLAVLGGTGVLLGVVESPPMQGTTPLAVPDHPFVAEAPLAAPALTSGFEIQDPPPRTRVAPPPPPDPKPERRVFPRVELSGEGLSFDISTGDLSLQLPQSGRIVYSGFGLASESLQDGFNVQTYDNGRRSAVGMARNGARIDEWNEWHEDGSPKSQGSYVHGRKHGPWTVWGPDGQLHSTGEYVYGMKEGDWTETGEDGRRRTAMYRGGKKYGTERVWHPGAQFLASETSWYADQEDGRARTWYDNGKPQSNGAYQNGEKVGLWEYWHEDGTPDEERSGVVQDPDDKQG